MEIAQCVIILSRVMSMEEKVLGKKKCAKKKMSNAGSNFTIILFPFFREHWFNNHHCKGCGLTFQNENFLSKHKSRSEKCNALPEKSVSLNSRENTSTHQALVKATSETPRYKRNRFVRFYIFLPIILIFCQFFFIFVQLFLLLFTQSWNEIDWISSGL